MTDDEIIEVVTAHKEGKQIQWVSRFEADKDINWRDDSNPKWNFEHLIYRVKPEPRKLREWWVEVPVDGSVGRLFQFERQTTLGGGELVRVREVIEE